jgi:hypothetical protein
VVRGTGTFEIVPLGPGRARLVWSEAVDLPGGAAGRLAWRLVACPLATAGVALSLRRFARWAARRPVTTP